MGKVIKIGTNILAVLSIILVIVLAVFGNRLFAFEGDDDIMFAAEKTAHITFDTDPLILTRKSDIDLMQGVTATGSDGSDIIDKVTASVVQEGSDKVIMYSVNDSDYTLESTKRGLQLSGYNGPGISVKKGSYTCDINEINSYIKTLINDGSIIARDGYGNDISANIYVDNTVQIKEAGKQKITLVVKNAFADVAKKDFTVNITGKLDETRVTLSTATTTIRKGAMFDPSRYIVTAVDAAGESIKDQIVCQNDVDVNTPGRYKVNYYIAGEDTENPVATLTVVVTE